MFILSICLDGHHLMPLRFVARRQVYSKQGHQLVLCNLYRPRALFSICYFARRQFSSIMPHATDPSADPHLYDPSKRRIVLCFDGTGNHYQGNPSDTNIVKLLEMFDHTKKNQKHYYQRTF